MFHQQGKERKLTKMKNLEMKNGDFGTNTSTEVSIKLPQFSPSQNKLRVMGKERNRRGHYTTMFLLLLLFQFFHFLLLNSFQCNILRTQPFHDADLQLGPFLNQKQLILMRLRSSVKEAKTAFECNQVKIGSNGRKKSMHMLKRSEKKMPVFPT